MASEEPEDERGWATVGRFSTVHEALVVQGTLEAHGFETKLRDAETVSVDWLLSNALGGVRVEVKAAAKDAALQALAAVPRASAEAPAEEEPDEPARDAAANAADEAKRALVAALLGVIVPVVPNLYSLFLLWQFRGRFMVAPTRARLWAAVALAIDGAVGAIVIGLLRG
ncbi:MAG: hypothetical protein U1E65_21235 [Myxococcota bacterium]